MATNRYDIPAQSQFINTYVPIPFEQMVAAGQVQQGRYDKAAAGLDQAVVNAENIQAIPNTVDYQYALGAQSSVKDIVDKYSTQDLGNSVVQRQINSEIRNAIDPSRVRRIQDSHANWQIQQQHKAQLIARGQYNPLIDEDPALDPNFSSEQGVYNHLSPMYEDPRPIAEKYFDDLRDNITNMQTPEGYYITGIFPKDIDRVTNERWRDFSETVHGQNLVKAYRKSTGDYDTPTKQIVTDYLKDVGKEFLHQGITGSATGSPGGGEPEEPSLPETSLTEETSLIGTGKRSHRNIPSVSDLTGGAQVVTTGHARQVRPYLYVGSDHKDREEELTGNEEAMKEYDRLKSMAKIYYGKDAFRGLSPSEEVDKIQDYVDDFYSRGTSTVVQDYNTSKEQEERRTLQFNLNQEGNVTMLNRPVQDPEAPAGQFISFDEVLKKYPLDKYEYIPVGKLSSNNKYFPSGSQVAIMNVNSDGETTDLEKKIYIGGDEYENSVNKFTHSVHQANYRFNPVTKTKGLLPLPNGSTTDIEGNINRRDRQGEDGRMYHEFNGEFTFVGANGKRQTITIGDSQNPVYSTEYLLNELLERILSVNK